MGRMPGVVNLSVRPEKLRYSGLPLREVAELVGFSDEHHLSRRFREVTGVPPRDYRRQPG